MKFGLDVQLNKNHQLMPEGFLIFPEDLNLSVIRQKGQSRNGSRISV